MITAAFGRLPIQRRAQPRVRGHVERREGVVEDIDLRSLHQRPCDRQALSLTARDIGATLRDRRLQLSGHFAYEVLGLSDPQSPPKLLVGGIRLAVPKVAGDGAREEQSLLRYQPDPAPEQLRIAVPYLDSVHLDRSAGGIEEPRESARSAWTCRRRSNR